VRDEHYQAKIVTKRNYSRLNNQQQLQLQGWRANSDIHIVIDHYACVEYLTKYAANGPNFGLYCKYHLLRYKPWRTTQNNAWDDQQPSDKVLINCWREFLQTPYGQFNVPDWFDKLQPVIQSQKAEDELSKEQETTCEEWMILSDLNTPFDNSEQNQIPHMTGISTEPIILNNKSKKCQH
ncbi:Hypothetical predicted protein, partial [Paramuricea clavata]